MEAFFHRIRAHAAHVVQKSSNPEGVGAFLFLLLMTGRSFATSSQHVLAQIGCAECNVN